MEEQKAGFKAGAKEIGGDNKANAYDLFMTPHQYTGPVKKIMPSNSLN